MLIRQPESNLIVLPGSVFVSENVAVLISFPDLRNMTLNTLETLNLKILSIPHLHAAKERLFGGSSGMIDSTNLKSTMNEPFESYAGEDPYIFVSYAHRDKESVYSTLKYLYDQKINIWYDEGILSSAEWVEEIAQAIKRSSLFVLFMSPQALASRYVINEINYAVSLNKNILTVYLEETLLSDGLALCLQPFQSLEVNVEDWLPRALAGN